MVELLNKTLSLLIYILTITITIVIIITILTWMFTFFGFGLVIYVWVTYGKVLGIISLFINIIIIELLVFYFID